MQTKFKTFFSTFYLSIILLLTFGAGYKMEEKPQGHIRYIRVGNWVKMMESVEYISEQEKAKNSYMWGNRSEWKSYCTLYFNDSISKYEDSDESVNPNEENWSYKKSAYTIKRNFDQNKMYDYIDFLGKNYIIEDTLVNQNWKILNDMKEVAGHICMNAFWEDTIKKQKIEAWFALDIPIPIGPERFGGLPGMILEIDINKGAMVITADKIELKSITTEVDLPKKLKGKKIKEADYQKLLYDYIQDKIKVEEPFWWGLRY